MLSNAISMTSLCGMWDANDGSRPIRYILCRGDCQDECESRKSGAEIMELCNRLNDQVSAALQRWDKDPCEECEGRLREVLQRQGARLFHAALDDAAQRLLYNYVQGCEVLSIVGDAVGRVPWEMMYLQGARQFLLADEAVVIRAFRYGHGNSGPAGFEWKHVDATGFRTVAHDAIDLNGVDEPYRARDFGELRKLLDAAQCIPTVGIGRAQDGEEVVELSAGPPSFAVAVDDFIAAGLGLDCLVMFVVCELSRGQFPVRLAQGRRATVVSSPVRIPRCVAARLVDEWRRALRGAAGGAPLVQVVQKWIRSVREVGVLFEIHGTLNVVVKHR